MFDLSLNIVSSPIYFLKRLFRLKWFEKVVVCFTSWRNRYAVWLVKTKRTNHLIVYRKNSIILKSGTLGTEVERKKQRRVPYFLKSLGGKIWSPIGAQIQIQLKGDLPQFDLATHSIERSFIGGRKRFEYSFYGFRKWLNRVTKHLKKIKRRRLRIPGYGKRWLFSFYYKPYIALHDKAWKTPLRRKWLEHKLLSPKERWYKWLAKQKKIVLKYKDKKKKTWYFYRTELNAAMLHRGMVHSVADYSSHPFGGIRYRKRNIIR